jgi:hypothetical protein
MVKTTDWWHLMYGRVLSPEVPSEAEVCVTVVAGPTRHDADYVNPATGLCLRFGIEEDGVRLEWLAQWTHDPTEEEVQDAISKR